MVAVTDAISIFDILPTSVTKIARVFKAVHSYESDLVIRCLFARLRPSASQRYPTAAYEGMDGIDGSLTGWNVLGNNLSAPGIS